MSLHGGDGAAIDGEEGLLLVIYGELQVVVGCRRKQNGLLGYDNDDNDVVRRVWENHVAIR